MNFCKENDKYISLYLDGLLDDNERAEFLKHIEMCEECAARLEEASYIIDLCREDKGLSLPENFSSSLHKRLLEETTQETKHKLSFGIRSKKLIAGLSTAAVLAISLLTYNLLPQLDSMQKTGSIAYDTAQSANSKTQEIESAEKYNTDKNEDAAAAKKSDDEELSKNTTSNNAEAGSNPSHTEQSGKDAAAGKKKDIILDRKQSEDKLKNSKQPEQKQKEIKNNETGDKRVLNKPEANAFVQSSAAKIQIDTDNFVSNHAEMDLKVSSGSPEIKELKIFMEKLGAVELKQDMAKDRVNNSLMVEQKSSENQEDTSAAIKMDTQLQSAAYIDYSLPLNLYSTIKAEAEKYKLELSVKTDIIIEDVTDEYNLLNKQISEVDTKITEAAIKGENTSDLDAEKASLIQEKDKIYSEKNMITVRIYYTDK